MKQVIRNRMSMWITVKQLKKITGSVYNNAPVIVAYNTTNDLGNVLKLHNSNSKSK